MAHIPRVLEKLDNGEREWSVENRQSRLEAILRDAERLADSYDLATRLGKYKEAKELRKRAHGEARMAARLIGVMEIEFGVPMAPQIVRARNIFRKIAVQNEMVRQA